MIRSITAREAAVPNDVVSKFWQFPSIRGNQAFCTGLQVNNTVANKFTTDQHTRSPSVVHNAYLNGLLEVANTRS